MDGANLPGQALAGNPADPCNNVTPVTSFGGGAPASEPSRWRLLLRAISAARHGAKSQHVAARHEIQNNWNNMALCHARGAAARTLWSI